MLSGAELFILGLVIFANIVFIDQMRAAIRRGEHLMSDPTGVNPLDYLFRPMPEGTYNTNQPFKKAALWGGIILGLAGPGWIIANVPEWATLGIFYALMAVICGMIYLAEEIDPKRSEVSAAMLFGYGKWEEQVLIGVALAVPFILINGRSEQIFQVMQIKGMVIGSFVVTVFIVPTVEEAMFRGISAPTIAEDAGVVHGALVSAMLFAVFHAYAYGFNWVAMFVVFVFGAIAGFVDLAYKSVLPSLVAHMLINFAAFLSWLSAQQVVTV